MALNVGAHASGSLGSFQKFSMSRFAYKHLFVVESKVGGAEMPSLFVSRGTFPFNEVTPYAIERDNSNMYFPEMVDSNSLEIEFYESMDNTVFDFFHSWHSMLFHSTEKGNVVFNLEDKYKHDIYVFRLDTMTKEGSNEFTRVFGYAYEGCFPIRISDYPLDMADAGVVSLSITFSCDNVRRLTGNGISQPQIMDRSSVRMDSSPLRTTQQAQVQQQTTLNTSNPVADKVQQNESRDIQIKKAEALWLEKEAGFRADAAGRQADMFADKYGKDRALWIKAIIKAAAKTGINIGVREAYYMAYSMAKKAGVEGIFGGAVGKVVTETRQKIKGGSLPG